MRMKYVKSAWSNSAYEGILLLADTSNFTSCLTPHRLSDMSPVYGKMYHRSSVTRSDWIFWHNTFGDYFTHDSIINVCKLYRFILRYIIKMVKRKLHGMRVLRVNKRGQHSKQSAVIVCS